jgi:glycosyltransferase involved in cell wall biosynthesis
MNVLYYADSLQIGGKERQIVELLKGLKQRDINVLLACMDQGEFYEPDVKALNIPIRYLLRKMRWDPMLARRSYTLVKEFRPDVIHSNGMMSSAYALPAAKLLGIPLINGSIRNAFRTSSMRWKVERTLLTLSDFRIANSMAGLDSRGFSATSGRDFVIHNGFDLSRVDSVQCAMGGKDRQQVGMIAEFRPHKDFRTFLLAARHLLKERPDVTFVTVGDGETLDAMRALVADAGDRIQFLGRRKDIEKIIGTFSVGVLATFTEGISNSIMEYMAMSKPVVVTDCQGSRELVRDGENGFIVPVGDHVALGGKIAYLLDHPEEARQMGRVGRDDIEKKFSLDAMVERTIDVYKRALQSANPQDLKTAELQSR